MVFNETDYSDIQFYWCWISSLVIGNCIDLSIVLLEEASAGWMPSERGIC